MPWLLLSVMAKKKFKEFWVRFDAEPGSDFYQSELQPLASKLSPRRIMQGQQRVTLITSGHQEGGPHWGRAIPSNY